MMIALQNEYLERFIDYLLGKWRQCMYGFNLYWAVFIEGRNLVPRVSPASLEEEERLNERSRAEHYNKHPPNQKDAAR